MFLIRLLDNKWHFYIQLVLYLSGAIQLVINILYILEKSFKMPYLEPHPLPANHPFPISLSKLERIFFQVFVNYFRSG